MSGIDLVKEVRASEWVQGTTKGLKGATARHLGDRSSGFLTALSFTPVGGDDDAALRAVQIVALFEFAQGLGNDDDAQLLRLGWRLADSLADYLDAKAGVVREGGRQTAEMEDLLRRAG